MKVEVRDETIDPGLWYALAAMMWFFVVGLVASLVNLATKALA